MPTAASLRSKVTVVIMMPNDASRRAGRPAAGGPGGPGRAAGDAAKIIGVRILAQKYCQVAKYRAYAMVLWFLENFSHTTAVYTTTT